MIIAKAIEIHIAFTHEKFNNCNVGWSDDGCTITKVLLITLFGIIAIDHGMDGTMSLEVGINFLSKPSQIFLQALAVTSSTKEPAKIGTKFNRI